MAIGDFFPALGQWIEGNRRAIEAPFRQMSQERAETLLGAEARPAMAQTDELGLTTGFDAYGGQGLMENPDDFYNQMQYGLGLMATPYYEQAGQAFMQNAFTSMLQGRSNIQERQRQQANWAAEMRMRQQEQQRKLDMMTGYGDNKPYANQTEYNQAANALFDDARAVTEPLRDSLRLYSDVQRTIGEKGITGMTLIDDTLLVKTLAKVQNPSEAVMEGDVRAIAASDTYDQLLRTLASKVGMAKELTPYERQMLYDALQNMGVQRSGELSQLRGHLTDQAVRRGVNPLDVLSPELEVDTANYRGPQQRKPLSTSGGDRGTSNMPPGAKRVENPSPELLEQFKDSEPPRDLLGRLYNWMTD